VTDSLSDADLDDIAHRVAGALEVAPPPWEPWLETRAGTGGGSFVSLGGRPDDDNEIYLDVRLGADQLTSPDARLDAIVDFLAHVAEDVPKLVAEVRRLRSERR
jgi:hypothetical protein